MTPPPGPRTEAGAQLLNEYTTLSLPRALNYILAIEAEARAGLDVERLVSIVKQLPAWSPHPDVKDRIGGDPLLRQRDVLDVIRRHGPTAYGGRDGLRAALERLVLQVELFGVGKDTSGNDPALEQARAALARGEEGQ